MTTNSKPKKILIVGGGTAGWMAASLLVSHWKDVEVCLLESDQVETIGVGEGSTPQLKFFFDAIDVPESEWMPQCNATYKNGITFQAWSERPGFESYFHPFPAQIDDAFTVPLFFKNIHLRIQGQDVNAHPDSFFLESYLTHNNLGPIASENFPFGVAYGYHFDSALLGKFLAKKSQARGVKRICGTVAEASLDEAGGIASLSLDDGRDVSADFFIDCTGFRSLLLQGALKVNFRSFKDNLFNDAAVALPSTISEIIPPETRSTALSNGWAWKIPLSTRFGNGYVYSSDYITPDQAELELRQHLNLLDSDVEAKHLKMKVGRVEKHWEKNCLAVGLSQGFIEPLEATALSLTFSTITQFMVQYERGQFTPKHQEAFNRSINVQFDGVRDYIVCHYKVNLRRDTDYWRDNAANKNLSETLQKILHLWTNSGDFLNDMHKNGLVESYQPKSWACLLAGYGVFPSLDPRQAMDPRAAQQEMDQLADFIRRCGLNFPVHNELLLPPA